jgi:ribosome-associated protein
LDIRKLQRAIVDGLEDVKAQHVAVFNTEHLSPLFERVIIASGTSNRQTKALAASVRDAVKSIGLPPPRTEGEDNGEWIIVDCGAAVAHIMQPAIRQYYQLEELWGDKPVRMKIESETKTALPKAAPVVAKKTPAGKAAPAKKVAAKKPAGKKAAPAKKTAPKKAPARKAVTRTVGVKRATAKTSAAKTSAAKTSAAKTPAAKKAATKKSPARR